MNHKILIIEDDHAISQFLKTLLETQGYQTFVAEYGKLGLNLALSHQPDVIILDLGLPDMDGLDWIRQYRGLVDSSILVVTAKDDHPLKVEALDLGADDYLTKPFNPAELLARVRVALRHQLKNLEPLSPIFEFQKLKVDFVNFEVYLDHRLVHCTPIEFQILSYLIDHRGKVCTSKMLINKIWGDSNYEGNLANLRVMMANLRRKIEEDTTSPQYIVTVLGVGYRFVD